MNKSTFDGKKILNRLIWIASIGILAHLAFVFFTTDRQIVSQLQKINFVYLVIIGGLLLIPWLMNTLRLYSWTKFLKEKLPLRRCFKIIVASELGSAITPTILGGGPIRLGLLVENGFSAPKATTYLGVSALEDVMFYMSGLLVAFIYSRESIFKIFSSLADSLTNNLMAVIIIVVIIIILMVMKRMGIFNLFSYLALLIPEGLRVKWNSFMTKLSSGIGEMKTYAKFIFRSGKKVFFLNVVFVFIAWMAKFTVLGVILYALDIDFNTIQIYVKQWLVWLTMLFIPTPGASGGAEASFYLILGNSIPKEILTLIISTWRFFTYYFMLFAAVVLFQIMSLKKSARIKG